MSERLENDCPGGPLRVCYGTHASNLTGANRSLLDLLAHLDRSRVHPVVLARVEGPMLAELDAMGIEWGLVPHHMLSIRNNRGMPWRDVLKGVVRGREVERVKRFIRSKDICLLHNNSILNDMPMQAARELDVPYVCHIRDMVQEDHNIQFLNEGRTRELVADASATVAISEFVAAKFSEWCSGERLRVIPDGVDASKYRIEHRPIMAGGRCELLMAGRFSPGKGQLDAIRAAEELRSRGHDAHLTLVGGTGDEAYRHACESYVEQHGLWDAVTMLGFLDDITPQKSMADVSLTCSYAEALGRATIEGMLAGCLVVGADAGATPEIVRHGRTGLLYEVGDAGALADCIARAIDSPKEARAMAVAGKQFALRAYDIRAYAGRVMDLYVEASEQHRKTRS